MPSHNYFGEIFQLPWESEFIASDDAGAGVSRTRETGAGVEECARSGRQRDPLPTICDQELARPNLGGDHPDIT